MKKQKIETIFSSMENFLSVPPPELWGQIEEKLNKPKKKKRVILWWSAAACLLLGLAIPSVLHLNSDSGIKNTGTTTIENNSVVVNKNDATSTQDKTVSDKPTIINQKTINSKNPVSGATDNQLATSQQKEETDKTALARTASKNNPNLPSEELNAEKKNSNQAVAQKSFVSEKQNAFNSVSTNQLFNSEKRAQNQTIAQKNYSPERENAFASVSKNQTADPETRKANQILAEKTFSAGKQNPFNATSKNQVSNSLFKEKLQSKNTNSFAYNSSNSILSQQQNKDSKNEKELRNGTIYTEKAVAEHQKNNSKFNNVLSKEDSVQLAVLQNLEKGIIAPESKIEKETKPLSPAEKWAVEVFAGIANSENYKNDKTLGYNNDSKQSSTYGVKTKYKINNKWAVGSGFKINELGQSIANISYMDVRGQKNMALGIADFYVQESPTPQIAATNDYVFVSNSTKEVVSSESIQSGTLNQTLKYIEMPLEVSYAVFSKNRTTVNLNTGGFVGKLISNNVALDGTTIGKNLDANDFVYGSVLSSTLQYRIYKKTNVFVEPAMNYYINPLNNQSFNQFQWGLNFGLNVSF
ncbi:outer membrane beta-barrel protein [Flavobacterium sp. FlaQc-50]|uniref:outer membrane beta-barrel protein n=1 Tax=unclassified Flavobacterium TaxID=196869 RepID=UPI003757CA7C